MPLVRLRRIHQRDPTIKPEIVTLKAADLDQLLKEKSKPGFIDFDPQSGYHVIRHSFFPLRETSRYLLIGANYVPPEEPGSLPCGAVR